MAWLTAAGEEEEGGGRVLDVRATSVFGLGQNRMRNGHVCPALKNEPGFGL